MRRLALIPLAFVVLSSGLAAARADVPAGTTVDAAHSVTVPFTAATAGEGLLDLTVAAPGADWSSPVTYSGGVRSGHAGGMLEIDVDGTKDTDLNVFTPAPTARQVDLGTLAAGPHSVVVRLGPASLMAAVTVSAATASVSTDPALAYTPVLYGRNLSAYDGGDPDQNVYDDAPVEAWHETTSPAPGQTQYQYSVIWTNEDNGTGSPDLMGRWGRTVDIELEYSVVFAAGQKVPTMETFQGPNHATTQFKGSYYEGTHPILQTCTGNNNFCDSATANEDKAVGISDPLQYFLSYSETRGTNRARETLVDAHPWIYGVMAAEQRREGKINPADCVAPTATGNAAADTLGVCDQRQYLFLELFKTTSTPQPMPDPTGEAGNLQTIGVSLDVRLRDGRVFTSDRGVSGRTAVRDVPINESVDLPAGTTPADVDQIIAVRQNSGNYPDSMSSVTVNSFNKMFFLDDSYVPRQSFIPDGVSSPAVLTTTAPSAVIWQRAATAAAALPETPAPVLLALAGLLVAAGAWSLRRRAAEQPLGV